MSYIHPNGQIQLFRGINLDNRYMHTLYFASIAAQTAFFDGLVDAGLNFTAQSYTRPNRNMVRLKIPADRCMDATYMRFHNNRTGSKWFYAFINAVNYINENTTEIVYEIDVMQTWFFQGGDIQPCFVKREHVSDDAFKHHLEPEPISSDSYRFDDITPDGAGSFDDYAVVINTTNEIENSDNYMVHGIFCGTEYYSQTTSTHGLSAIKGHLLDALGSWDKQEQSADVVDMYMFPSKYTGYGSPDVDTFNVPFKKAGTDTYKPFNKKMYTYPYCFLYATTKNGSACQYRWEYFDSDVTSGTQTVEFHLDANDTGGGSIIVYPDLYNGILDNVDSKLTMDSFPKCSWSYDAYQAFVAAGGQTKLNAEAEIVNMRGAVAAIKSMGDITTAMKEINDLGAIEGIKDITPGGMANKMLDASIAPFMAAANIMDKYATQKEAANKVNFAFKDAMYAPDIMIGRQVPNIAVGRKFLGVYFYNGHVAPEDMVRVDNFFTTYGYAINDIKKPNLTGRPYWNFVQTDGAQIKGNMPASSKEAIARIFDGGIFFWNSSRGNDNIGHFQQNYDSTTYGPHIRNH